MDRQQKIVSMFDEIAKSYDLANRVMSFGSDVAWRRRACDKAFEIVGGRRIQRVVDVACGTGDMLGFWQERAKKHEIAVEEYIGVDPSAKMLEVAKKKFPHFHYIQAFAQDLPLEDESADILSITYGIRNVVEREDALKEFYRILKPGGVLVILEFTKQEKRFAFIDSMVEWYLKRVLPIIGGVISGNREAYEYLPQSIDRFLTSQQLSNEIEAQGLQMCEVRSFSFGVSTLFIAKKDGKVF